MSNSDDAQALLKQSPFVTFRMRRCVFAQLVAGLKALSACADAEVGSNELSNSDSADEIDGLEAMRIAHEELVRREVRHRHFPKALYGEPGWEMILLLYTQATHEGGIPAKLLSEMAGAPLTTGLRWIDYLEASKLVERQTDVRDRRISQIKLSDRGKTMMYGYLSEIAAATSTSGTDHSGSAPLLAR